MLQFEEGCCYIKKCIEAEFETTGTTAWVWEIQREFLEETDDLYIRVVLGGGKVDVLTFSRK